MNMPWHVYLGFTDLCQNFPSLVFKSTLSLFATVACIIEGMYGLSDGQNIDTSSLTRFQLLLYVNQDEYPKKQEFGIIHSPPTCRFVHNQSMLTFLEGLVVSGDSHLCICVCFFLGNKEISNNIY